MRTQNHLIEGNPEHLPRTGPPFPALTSRWPEAAVAERHEGGDAGSRIRALRAQVLAGLASIEAYAEAISRAPRTVTRMISEGLPVVYIGATPYVDIAKSRYWLEKRSKARCVSGRAKSRK